MDARGKMGRTKKKIFPQMRPELIEIKLCDFEMGKST
jgi:hypothetical protein